MRLRVKLRFLIIPALLPFFTLRAAVTPLDQPLADQEMTTITCELTQPPPYSGLSAYVTRQDVDATIGTYHYKLWLPGGYSAAPARQWPCMFIMNAQGNAVMATMAPWLKSNGFIVVQLVEAQNGPWPPIIGNFLAAHDDVIQRARVAGGEKYATGVSGGARASSLFVQLRPGFRGLVLQAAGVMFDGANHYIIDGLKRTPGLRIAMTIGNADPNTAEIGPMKSAFDSAQLRVFEFNGGHDWAPAFVFEKAMRWLTGTGSAEPGGTSGDPFDDFFREK
jgi:hypothetical protein